MILKATAKRKAESSCDAPHGGGKVPARWEVEFSFVGKLNLCTTHYRELTRWECEYCQRPNHGMTWRCQCGWVRPDVCRKCGQISEVPLIKITERRDGHPCHECGGSGRAKGFAPCPECHGRDMGTRGCCACFGSGINAMKDKPCESCDGTGKSAITCGKCRGRGEVLTKFDRPCPSCEGNGSCFHSSARWNIDRIALTDIRAEHREKLREFVGQYLCFTCANPDFQFSSYKKRDESAQCLHYELVKGQQVRCTNMIARSNPNDYFCFRHSEVHLCEVCGKRLLLDEWGRRCREHAKCACCDKRPFPGSLFCLEHRDYKALGKIIEKQRVPETPVQILRSQERVLRATEIMIRRRDSSLRRSQSNTLLLRQAEQEAYEILLYDPPENEPRRKRIEEIESEIAKISLETEEERLPPLQEEIGAIERLMDEARTLEHRVKIRALQARIKGLEKSINDDFAIYLRYRRTGMELEDLSKRLSDLRRYELWEPKGTPEVKGEPYYILCKKCGELFNARATKWLCPHCTTAEAISMAEGGFIPSSTTLEKFPTPLIREGRTITREDDIIVIAHLPTDNRPRVEPEPNYICEVCGRNSTVRLKAARLYRPDKPVNGLVEWRVYFACPICRSENPKDLIRREQGRLGRAEEGKREQFERQRNLIQDRWLGEREKIRRHNEFREMLDLPPIEEEDRPNISPKETPEQVADPLPPCETKKEMQERFKREDKEKRRIEATKAARRFGKIIAKDHLSPGEREEARKLLSILQDAKKEFGITIPTRTSAV